MLCRVAAVAEGNKIVFVVLTGMAAKFLVMDFKVGH
jgi:hypothetical protein